VDAEGCETRQRGQPHDEELIHIRRLKLSVFTGQHQAPSAAEFLQAHAAEQILFGGIGWNLKACADERERGLRV
jgi:hypothetical protein